MRVIAAGLFVFSGLLAAVAILGSQNIFDRAPTWVIAPGLVLLLCVLVASSLWLFNPKGALSTKSAEEHIRDLEQRGLLESTQFRATRAFGVEEFEDEGLHNGVPEDGHVITARTYDALKRERLGGAAANRG